MHYIWWHCLSPVTVETGFLCVSPIDDILLPQDLRSTAIYGEKIIIFKILPLYIVPLRKSYTKYIDFGHTVKSR